MNPLFDEREMAKVVKSLTSTNRYNAKMYSDIPMELRDRMYAFLLQPRAIQAMTTAAYWRKPSIPALSDWLVHAFGGDTCRKRRVKMMLGSMARHILKAFGLRLDKEDVPVTISGNVFAYGSRYALQPE